MTLPHKPAQTLHPMPEAVHEAMPHPAKSLQRRAWLMQALRASGALTAHAGNKVLLASTATWLHATDAATPDAQPVSDAAHPHPGLPDPRPLQLGPHVASTTPAQAPPQPSWRDHGSHPEWNTEWWYVTGWAQPHAEQGALAQGQAPAYGFQLTFFRSRVRSTTDMDAPLAAQHLISAHLAVTDVRAQRLLHEERVGRASRNPDLSLGEARVGDLHVRLGNWQLSRKGSDLQAQLPGRALGLDLRLQQTQAPVVQGQGGLSRKGPDAQQISYYYSLPQLAVSGALRVGDQQHRIVGRAWLDHEWSTALMHPSAVGWDWIGMNLDNGSALTAFRLRDVQGQTLWTGGSWRDSQHGQPHPFGGQAVHFEPLTHWTSPSSQATYPVQWCVSTPAGVFEVRALTPQQELDARASTGAIYWEGLCALHLASGPRVGWGYLEMTGYAHRLKL